MFLSTACLFVLAVGLTASTALSSDLEQRIDFQEMEVGKPAESYQSGGVTFQLAHPPTRSRAVGRIMFFPHLGTDRIGILSAMANEVIPVRATFDRPAKRVQLVLWGSTTSAAKLQAFDKEGEMISESSLDRVPVRQRPEENVPFFEMEVEGAEIHFIELSGWLSGGYVAIDELRWDYVTD